jgi:hypothetical protein
MTTDTFFGAVDPRTIRDLAAGTVVTFTYDDLGARRPNRYHLVTGTVDSVNQDAERGLYVNLTDITITRPSGDVSTRPRFNYRAANILEVSQ